MLKLTLICLVGSLARLRAESVSADIDEVHCPPPSVLHGRLKLSQDVYRPGDTARLVCREGYQLDGSDEARCDAEGNWLSAAHPESRRLPQCRELSCAEPAPLESGRLDVQGPRAADGTRFKHGAVAIYRCDEGFQLRGAGGGGGGDSGDSEQRSARRVCTDGEWLGGQPTCARTECGPPPVPSRGIYLELLRDGSVALPRRDRYPVGARAVYRCNPAHVLIGTTTYQCMRSGEWSPPVAPGCQAEQPTAPLPTPACGLPEREPLTIQRLVRGWLSDVGASAGAVVEYSCTEGTRDRLSPCRPQRLTCYSGRWLGRRPHCLPVTACSRPPAVPHGDAYGDGRAPGAEVFYTCWPGYNLLGPRRLTCDAGGCWSPARLAPVCQQQPAAGTAEPTPLLSPVGVTLLAVTVAVLLLLVLLLVLLLQRRAWKPLRRPPPTPPPSGPGRTEDADRVALIAYQEGSQFVLPTYEEAVRSERTPPALSEPGPGALAARLHHHHHHHHRSLPPAARRERLWRREQESDSVSQRSVQSHHSASRQSNTTSNATPSLLDSMGSTDTMATSDAVSNTLSAAATASVRGMCGSLASFDTSSVLNTEGVPLLEENETELEGAEQDDSVSCGKSSAGDAASNK